MDNQTKVSDFSIQGKLGEGAFSSVYKVLRKSDRKTYAMKQVKMQKLTEREKINAVNEVRILASLNDPNIIGYKEAFYDEYSRCLCIIQEFAEGGDVMSQISQKLKKKQLFDEELIWNWFIQMIQGLKSLHGMNIMHRDMKSANIFLTKNFEQVKLGDLNVSKVTKRNQLAYTQTGTPYYAAPEIWKDSPYSNKCDIWSLGCVVYEICSLKPPFRAQNMEGLYKKIQKGNFDRIPQLYTNDLQGVINLCLTVNTSQRPNCDQLLKHPAILRRINQYENLQTESSIHSPQRPHQLINTIKLPRNLRQLKERLPKPTYQSQVEVIPQQNNSSFRRSPLRSRSIENNGNNSPSNRSNRDLSQKPQRKALQQVDLNQQQQQQQQQQQLQQGQKQYSYLTRGRAGSVHTHNKGKLQLQLQQQQQQQIQQQQQMQKGVSPSNKRILRNLIPQSQKENIMLPNLGMRSNSNHNIQKGISQTPQIQQNQKLKVVQYQNQRNIRRMKSSDRCVNKQSYSNSNNNNNNIKMQQQQQQQIFQNNQQRSNKNLYLR